MNEIFSITIALAGLGLFIFWWRMFFLCANEEAVGSPDRGKWLAIILCGNVIGAFVYYHRSRQRKKSQ